MTKQRASAFGSLLDELMGKERDIPAELVSLRPILDQMRVNSPRLPQKPLGSVRLRPWASFLPRVWVCAPPPRGSTWNLGVVHASTGAHSCATGARRKGRGARWGGRVSVEGEGGRGAEGQCMEGSEVMVEEEELEDDGEEEKGADEADMTIDCSGRIA
jgi:hypothetical protein